MVSVGGLGMTSHGTSYDRGHKFITAVIGHLAASPSAKFESPSNHGTMP